MFPQLVFSVARLERMFWQLLPALDIEGPQYRLLLLDATEWMEKHILFDEKKEEIVQPHSFGPNEEGRSTREKNLQQL